MNTQRMDGRMVAAAAMGLGLTLAVAACSSSGNEGADAMPESGGCTVVQAPMRDGINLATEVYLPEGDGPFPVILQRTPYNRRSPDAGSDCELAAGSYFAERGYATLNQDTRGRYRSEGEFDAMRQEAGTATTRSSGPPSSHGPTARWG